MVKGKITAFPLMDKSVDELIKKNLNHAKTIIKNLDSFHPTMFLITSKALYYVTLDTDLAEKTQTSPNDQIYGLERQFIENEERLGEVLAYQVIGEAWMKSFRQGTDMTGLKHGDIAKMANRIEVLTNVIVRKGMRRRFQTFEIIREEPEIEDSKVIEFKDFKLDSAESDKFPEIPKQISQWSGKL